MDADVQEFSSLLDEVKSGVRAAIQEIGDQGINWSPPIPEANSAAVLVTHMFGSEAKTIHEYIGGTPVDRDRESEFAAPLSTVQELLGLIDRVGARTRDVVAKETTQSLGRQVRTVDPAVTRTVRRSLTRVLMHQAEHVGHMQLTEQLRRADATQEGLAKLRPAFGKEGIAAWFSLGCL